MHEIGPQGSNHYVWRQVLVKKCQIRKSWGKRFLRNTYEWLIANILQYQFHKEFVMSAQNGLADFNYFLLHRVN